MADIQFYCVLQHGGADLQTFFGGCCREAVGVFGSFVRIGDIGFVADGGISTVGIFGSQHKAGIKLTGGLGLIQRDCEAHGAGFGLAGCGLHFLCQFGIRQREGEKIDFFALDVLGIADGCCDFDFFGRSQGTAGDGGRFGGGPGLCW